MYVCDHYMQSMASLYPDVMIREVGGLEGVHKYVHVPSLSLSLSLSNLHVCLLIKSILKVNNTFTDSCTPTNTLYPWQ